MKNFSIFKVKEKKNDKAPDYNITMKVGDAFVNIGAGWIKDGKGGKYISCKLSDGFTSAKGSRKGFAIKEDGETKPEVTADDIIL